MLTHKKIILILVLLITLAVSLVFAGLVSLTTHTLNGLITASVPSVVAIQPSLSAVPVEAQICRVFGSQCKMALAVSQAENGTRACNRKSSTNDFGVFQINIVHADEGYNLTNCTENILIAKKIYNLHGWSAWTAYKNGSYKKFLVN